MLNRTLQTGIRPFLQNRQIWNLAKERNLGSWLSHPRNNIYPKSAMNYITTKNFNPCANHLLTKENVGGRTFVIKIEDHNIFLREL